jgi:hypothetical protein
VDKDTTSGLLSGTTSVLMVPWDKRWLVIEVQDVAHAVDPGTPGVALCGVRPPKGARRNAVAPAPVHQRRAVSALRGTLALTSDSAGVRRRGLPFSRRAREFGRSRGGWMAGLGCVLLRGAGGGFVRLQ